MNKEIFKNNPYFKNVDLEHSFDATTGVLNRETIIGYAKYLISKNIKFSAFISDIDNFKYINDTYGHLMGDKVLEGFGKFLPEAMGDKCIVGRYGGDEFLSIATGLNEYKEVWTIGHIVNNSLFKLEFKEIDCLSITITTGISRFPIDGTTYEDIFMCADKALYRGKTKGRNCFIIYNPEMHKDIVIKEDNESLRGSILISSQLFNILTKNDNLKDNIISLFKYFTTTLSIDHVAIETKDKILFSTKHPTLDNCLFKHIDDKVLIQYMNSMGYFSLNHRKNIIELKDNKLSSLLEEQGIKAQLVASITAYGKTYGVLRADMTHGRVWQNGDISLINTAARLIGVILANKNITREDL